MSRILQNLHRRGFVERNVASDDQRRSVISIAPRGRVLFEQLSPINEAHYAEITARFGYGKLELLYELLDEPVEKMSAEETGANV